MRRAVRWTFLLFGGFLLARGGVSIFSAPEHEVLYGMGTSFQTCVPEVCTTSLELEVGNTGTEPQTNVRIRLRAAPLAKAGLPLTIRNHGVVDREVRVVEAGGERIYDLGLLEPQKRVKLQAVYLTKGAERAPSWSEIFVAVEPAAGEARRGDPSGVMFARLMHSFFGWL